MVCPRCRGFLVCEMFYELSNDTESLHTRCINCGCIDDAVMRADCVDPVVSGRIIPHRHRTGRKRVAVVSKHEVKSQTSIRCCNRVTAGEGSVGQPAPASSVSTEDSYNARGLP